MIRRWAEKGGGGARVYVCTYVGFVNVTSVTLTGLAEYHTYGVQIFPGNYDNSTGLPEFDTSFYQLLVTTRVARTCSESADQARVCGVCVCVRAKSSPRWPAVAVGLQRRNPLRPWR